MDYDATERQVNVARDGKVHVRANRCGNCLLSPDRIVSGARAREIFTSMQADSDAFFVCHRNQVSAEPEAICAGWYEAFGDQNQLLRMANAMGVIEYVTVDIEHDKDPT